MPIDDDEAGYGFALDVKHNAKVDAARILNAIIKALRDESFTGRCECYQDIGLIEGDKVYWISIGLRWEQEVDRFPSYDWWVEFVEKVRPDLESDSHLTLSQCSGMATLGDIRASQSLAMIIEFVAGKAVGFLDPDEL